MASGNLQTRIRAGQFTSADFTSVLLKNGIAISMDGKGSCVTMSFIERLWRSVKWEEVYLRAYDTVSEARTFDRFLSKFLYIAERPHSSLNRQTPDQVYFQPATAAASGVIDRWDHGGAGTREGDRNGCGHDALHVAKLGQRNRVAHMPTAGAEEPREA